MKGTLLTTVFFSRLPLLCIDLRILPCAVRRFSQILLQTYEKFGFLLSFWNLAGVPFTYSYSILYMAINDPAKYRFPLWGNVLLYVTLLTAYFIFDTSMAQKSYFKMEQDGNSRPPRNTFPNLPYSRVKNPKFVRTHLGGKLLVDGWWKYCRKPNYSS